MTGANKQTEDALSKRRKLDQSSTVYTVFISHAGEDKSTIALPLRERLREHGISTFVDEADMPAGTEAGKAMTAAMETAEIAVVVLSPEFVARKWPMKELMCFLERRKETAEGSRCRPMIIPFFYRLSVSELYDEPRLDRLDKDDNPLYHESRFFERMKNKEPEANIAGIKEALTKIHGIMGIRNDLGISNDCSHVMSQKRAVALEQLCEAVRQALSEKPVNITADDTRTLIEDDEFHPHYDSAGNSSKLVLKFFEGEELYADTLEGKILEVIEDRSSDEKNVVAMYGIGGVGKTSVLQGLLGLERVKQRFEDGIYFISLGMDTTEHSLMDALIRTVKKCGGQNVAREMHAEKEICKVIEQFQSWFTGKNCLFMVDDIWETKEMSSSVIRGLLTLHETGGDSKVLLTTRSMDIASRATVCYPLEPLKPLDPVARAMLLRYAVSEPRLGCPTDKKVVDDILEKCCGLPLFLTIAGKAVRALSFRKGCGESAAYHVYARSLNAHMHGFLSTDVDSYRRLESSLSLSIELLESRKEVFGFDVRLSIAEMHRRLSLLAKQEKVPMSMLRHLWELEGEAEAAIVSREFEQLGLVDVEIEENDYKEMLCLHDSLQLFASTETKKHGDKNAGYEAILKGYARSLDIVRGCREWWSSELIADGYIHRHICRHLLHARHGRELFWLLMTPQWAERQLEVSDMLVLLADFSFGIKAFQDGMIDDTASGNSEAEETLRLLSEAITLSSSFISDNPRELWFQVSGRLAEPAKRSSGVLDYLNRVREKARMPWLQSKNRLLAEPGGSTRRIFYCGVCMQSMVMTTDGERVLCGCDDGSIIIVNVMREKIEGQLSGHDDVVSGIAIAKQGAKLVSVSRDETAVVWDIEVQRDTLVSETGKRFKGHKDAVQCAAVMEDGVRVITSSWDRTTLVWDLNTGELLSEPFRDREKWVQCVAVLPDREHAVAGGRDNALRLWNVPSGTQLGKPFVGHKSLVMCVAVSAERERIVSGSRDKTVRVWDTESHEQIGESLEGHMEEVTCIAVSKDGNHIISGSADNTIRLWDIKTGKEVCEALEGHTDVVTGVSFVNGNDSVVSCSRDGTIRMWDLHRKKAKGFAEQHKDTVWSVSFTPDGKYVVSGSLDGTLRIWDTTSMQQVGDPLCGHSDWVSSVAVTPDGRRIISVSYDMTVRIWDFQSRKLFKILRGHSYWINSVAVMPNSERAVTGSEDKTVRVWDLVAMDGSHVVLEGHEAAVWKVFVSDDGNRVVSVDNNDDIYVWQLQNGARQYFTRTWSLEARKLWRKDVFRIIGEETCFDNAGLSIPMWGRSVIYEEDEDGEDGKDSNGGAQKMVLATLEADVWGWALSPDGKTVCVALRGGKVGFMTLEK